MKKYLFLLNYFFPLALSFGSSSNFPSNLTDSQKKELLNNGVIRESVDNPADLTLIPETTLSKQILPQLINTHTKTNAFALYYMQSSHKPKALNFLNGILNVGSLSGLQYYSRSEKKEKVLIYSVSLIEGENSKNIIAREVGIPISFIIEQNDETFGIAKYSMNVQSSNKGEILLHIKNIDPLKQGLITISKPGEFNFFLGLIPSDDGILVYGLSANVGSPPSFVKKKADQSLFNRIDAFKTWAVAAYNLAK